MAKIKVGKLRLAYQYANVYKKQRTKFGYACLKGFEKIGDAIKKHESELADRQNELASVDEKTKNLVLTERGGYTYTPKSDKTLKDLIKKQNEEEVEYEPYFATNFDEIAEELDIIELLNGIIVNVDIEKYIDDGQQATTK